MSEPIIEVRHLSKSFGTHVVLRDVDFTVNHGDVTCVIGASGSGKSFVGILYLLSPAGQRHQRPASPQKILHQIPAAGKEELVDLLIGCKCGEIHDSGIHGLPLFPQGGEPDQNGFVSQLRRVDLILCCGAEQCRFILRHALFHKGYPFRQIGKLRQPFFDGLADSRQRLPGHIRAGIFSIALLVHDPDNKAPFGKQFILRHQRSLAGDPVVFGITVLPQNAGIGIFLQQGGKQLLHHRFSFQQEGTGSDLHMYTSC